MIDNVLYIIQNAISSCFSWITELFTSTGTINLVLGVFALSAMTRLLIIPIIGGQTFSGAASDSVRKLRARVKLGNQYRKEKIDSGNAKLGDGK